MTPERAAKYALLEAQKWDAYDAERRCYAEGNPANAARAFARVQRIERTLEQMRAADLRKGEEESI
jgi:hypothetical protein